MEKITDSFTKSLIMDNEDILSEYAELGIDLLIDSNILKEIPIVNTIVGGAKVVKAIRDRNAIKNLIQFINEINIGNVNKQKLHDYQKELISNPKKAEIELGRVLLILDSNIDNEKNIMVGKLFKAYINGDLNWDDFCELTEVVRRLFVQDIELLKRIYNGGGLRKTALHKEMYRMDRVQSLGITGISPTMIGSSNNLGEKINMVPNKMGRLFMKIIFGDIKIS